MLLASPVPFREALDAAAIRSILTTTGTHAQLQRLEPAIKQRSLWSATVSIAEPLLKLRDGVQAILTGQADQATVRLGIKQLWQDLGYQPDPEKIGGLQDLSSTKRINLQIETNVATARGAGWYEQGQQPEVLEEFPAQELFDTAPNKTGNRRDIAARWAECGGTFIGERMIALKTDPIWQKLGDSAKYPDGIGNPYAPFWLNSYWRVRDIARADAIEWGLMTENTELLPQPLDLEADLAATPALREQWLRDAITESGVGRFDSDGVLLFNPDLTTP